MTRRKRTSRVLEKAALRSACIKAIDNNLDLGDACNLKNMTQLIEQLRTKLEAHNTALTAIDSSTVEIGQLEKTLSSLSEKMLIGIAFKYGSWQLLVI
ncbi:MAG: hypothetical protein KME21_24710 [Desmonostoc vinosum HA7617-LM4]|jgi:hypothetical protein|nr:hypothetical protein [Desmonostoc vinosum HA7617-LM4]